MRFVYSYQMSLTKWIVVVDADVDGQSTDEVMFYVGANVDPERDIQIVHGPIDVPDHASDMTGHGGKIGIDATRKWASEGFPRRWMKEAGDVPGCNSTRLFAVAMSMVCRML